jgi:hypothetical protein
VKVVDLTSDDRGPWLVDIGKGRIDVSWFQHNRSLFVALVLWKPLIKAGEDPFDHL